MIRLFKNTRILYKKSCYMLVIIILLGLLQIPFTIFTPYMYKVFIDNVLIEGKYSNVLFVVAGIAASAVSLMCIKLLCVSWENKFYSLLDTNIRTNIIKHFLYMDLSAYEKISLSDRKMRMEDDADSLEQFYRQQVVESSVLIIKLICFATIMLIVNKWLFLVALVFVPITFYIGSKLAKGEFNISEKLRVQYQDKDEWLINSLKNWKEIKTLELEHRELDSFTSYYNKIGSLNVKWIWYWMMQDLILPLMKDEILLKFVLYAIGGYMVINGNTTVGTVLVFVNYYGSFYEALNKINSDYISYKNSVPGIDRALQILQSPLPPINDSKVELTGRIRFKHVDFRYPDNIENTLSDITFDIAPGEKIAVVGASGVGKTTLIRIIAGMLQKTGGQVWFDDVELENLKVDAIYKNISIVMQDSQLFNLSVRDNLVLGKRDISDEMLDSACDKTDIREYIHSLPEGYNTIIGESGLKLSGGQRQRLVLARMLLSNAGIYIMDEATSSVDGENDRHIQNMLSSLHDKTMFIIAHRLSSVEKADRVMVIKEGRIAAFDTHDNLRGQNAAYDELFME